MESTLEILFESIAKIRILRLFLQNSERSFALSEIVSRTQIKRAPCSRELAKLLRAGLVRQKMGRVREESGTDQKGDAKKNKSSSLKAKKVKLYFLDTNFSLLSELSELVLKSAATDRKRILQQVRRLGKIKLAIISGIFINNDTTRTDLFIVGDDIKQKALGRFLQQIESELGKPIQYTVMDMEEYKYRMNMYDRFLRDILERPHEKLINKLHS